MIQNPVLREPQTLHTSEGAPDSCQWNRTLESHHHWHPYACLLKSAEIAPLWQPGIGQQRRALESQHHWGSTGIGQKWRALELHHYGNLEFGSSGER